MRASEECRLTRPPPEWWLKWFRGSEEGRAGRPDPRCGKPDLSQGA